MPQESVKPQMHTGCSCKLCKSGRTKSMRCEFHRKVRHTHKRELKRSDEITTVDISIGYTD